LCLLREPQGEFRRTAGQSGQAVTSCSKLRRISGLHGAACGTPYPSSRVRPAASNPRRVGALLASYFDQLEATTAFEQLLQQEFLGATGQEARPKLTEYAKVEAWISQVKTQQVLPVDARTHRLCGLAIRQIFPKLQNGHEHKAPGRKPGLTICKSLMCKSWPRGSKPLWRGQA
jgi:hypothetical protein